MVEKAVILCDSKILQTEHFDILHKKSRRAAKINHEPELMLDLETNEMNTVKRALENTNNNKSKAAKLLSISRQALDRKIRKYGIDIYKLSHVY